MNDLECLWAAGSPGGGGGSDPNAVKFTPQTLTDAQQAQARSNIGIESEVVYIDFVMTSQNEFVVTHDGEEWTAQDTFDAAAAGKSVIGVCQPADNITFIFAYSGIANIGDDDHALFSFGVFENDIYTVYTALLPDDGTNAGFLNVQTVLPKRNSLTGASNVDINNYQEYVLTGVSSLSFSYPSGNFECWIKLTTASSGTVTITFPSSTYIGDIPEFGNGETWEISIKDGVIIAGKVITGA